MAITKPPVVPPWADTAAPGADIVQPSDEDISAGWQQSSTPPSRQRFNWILNFLANAVRYFSRRGIVDWDASETYMSGDIVRGDNGRLYRSLQDSNTNHLPSAVGSAWWGSLETVTPSSGDNSNKVATTAYVQASITGKANTSGTYPGLTVGNATQAANAAVAATAGSVPWAGVTGKPATVAGYGITDAIHTGNIGSQSVAFATTAGRARPRRSDNTNWDLIWTGQGGQPNWLVGSNDGLNFYVWNPANFSVNHATNADFATTQPAGTSNTRIATTQFANPAQSLGASGYVKLPGGLIFQWGSLSVGDLPGNPPSGVVYRSAVFPIAFPTAVLQVRPSVTDSSGQGGVGSAFLYTANRSSFTVGVNETAGRTQNVTINWFAFGY